MPERASLISAAIPSPVSPGSVRLSYVAFAREGIWAEPPEGEVDDRFVTGFVRLIRIAGYGYKSLLEFLPGRVGRLIRFLLSLLPRIPRQAATQRVS